MKLVNTLLVGLTLTLLVSCGGEPILKKWKLDDINIEALLKEMPKESQDMMRQGAKENMAKTKGKVTLEFKEGGVFTAENPSMDGTTTKENGKWKLSEDKKTLTAEIKGDEQIFVVHELSGDKMILEPKDQKMQLIFIPKD